MDVESIKHKADRELESMQGCLPAIDNLPVDVSALYDRLIELSRLLHSSANRLAGFAGYLASREGK